MEYKDYYEIRGVVRDATQEEIKRAYRKLARKYHPDVSKEPDAEVRFKEVGETNEVLKDSEKRAAYDQLGRQWKNGQEFSPRTKAEYPSRILQTCLHLCCMTINPRANSSAVPDEGTGTGTSESGCILGPMFVPL